jgi:Zn-dependent protease with chaperone function
VTPVAAVYFDGKNSLKHEVSLLIGGGKVKLVGRDVQLEFSARKVRVAPRLGNTPRWLYLPGGGACVVADNDAVDRFTRERPFTRVLNRLEARPAYAVAAIVLVAGLLWLLIDRGLPPVVEYIAERIPRGAETALGEKTLEALSEEWFRPSTLPRARQDALRAEFNDLVKSAGDTGPLRLEFRASPVIGPNAFALPSGIIVVTDELVKLARNDQQVLAVLAHEIGHVHYRHTMRRLLQSSATALIIAAVTGDIASTTSLAASAPALLLQARYSRDYEREADAFAIALLQRTGIGAQNFAAILQRLEGRHHRSGFVPTFLASHPPTAEREALARAAAGTQVAEENDENEFSDAVALLNGTKPRRAPLAIIDPQQKRIAELLEKRDFAGLDGYLDGLRSRFESDPSSTVPLENAFRAFESVPRRSLVMLDEWVKAAPASYNAHLARAAFWLSRGVEERGQGFAGDASRKASSAMEVYFDASLVDLERSRTLSGKPYLTRRYMMTIMLYTGSRYELEENYEEALKLAPASVETRLAYMRGLEPRWGGSYDKMTKYAAEQGPSLAPDDAKRLLARIPGSQGFDLIREKNYNEAVKQLTAAIALDPDAEYFCGRAYARGEIEPGKAALQDAASGLAKARASRYCVDTAVWVAARVDDPPEVIRVMSMVIEVAPENAAALAQRGWGQERTGKLELAVPDYLAAAKLGHEWAQKKLASMDAAKAPARPPQ